MKSATTPKASAPRSTRDTLCKRLAEDYPEQFARWLFGARGKVKVEKTELDREPIRADSVIFSHDDETLHTEFQTTMKSDVPVPLRLLDYYVGFKRQKPNRRVRQVLVVLKPTDDAIPDRYEDECTTHRYTKENDMLEESVVYQDILRKGEQRGEQKGKQKLTQRQLEWRFGKLPPGIQKQLEGLVVAQLEALGVALLNFQTRRDMLAWFKEQAVKI
jgi:predicted transposase YdaD